MCKNNIIPSLIFLFGAFVFLLECSSEPFSSYETQLHSDMADAEDTNHPIDWTGHDFYDESPDIQTDQTLIDIQTDNWGDVVQQKASYPDEVIDVTYGTGAGFGQNEMPQVVLGKPEGSDGNVGSLDVVSLGNGGRITLMFPEDAVITDGPGVDFIIFENPFHIGGSSNITYAEVAVVEVSQDGTTFYGFPYDYQPNATKTKERFIGFAGITPTGDGFDLSIVGLSWAKYVRITDCGKLEETKDSRLFDKDNDFVDDPGNLCCGGDSEGFDLDGIMAIHSGQPN